MFRRRTRRSLPDRIRESLWPRAGWRRWTTYLTHRVRRMPGTPHRIAAGLAAGAAVSCAPLPGVHFLLAVVLALATRGSPLTSLIGTAFGNPWTFPILWGAAYRIGAAVVPGASADATPGATEFGDLLRVVPGTLASLDLSTLAERLLPVWLPAMAGSLPLGLAVWIAVYASSRRAVAAYRKRRTAALPPASPSERD